MNVAESFSERDVEPRLRGGFIGVDIFFVISGYLISTIVFGSLERGTFSIAESYRRRVRRIFPALISVLLASAIFGWMVLLDDGYAQIGEHIAAASVFVQNFILWHESGYFDNEAARNRSSIYGAWRSRNDFISSGL